MTNISYKGKTLTIGGNAITLNAPIESILVMKCKILVLVQDDSSRDNKKYGNILSLNKEGEKIWEIEATKKHEGWYRPFTGIYLRENTPIAYSPIGIEYEIDIDTGRLINIPNQRPW